MGSWKPPLSPKQFNLLKLCRRVPGAKRYVLVSGPRFSTKTIGCLHAIADHAFRVKNASIAIISPTVSAGDDSGCWTQLTEQILPEWIDANIGMEWVSPPKMKGASKKLYCKVSNMHGGVSTIQLDSLQHEKDVEGKFKNKNYSMMYVSELSFFRERKTYDIWIECLRGMWQEHEYLFVGDTNPAEEGEDSWIWKHWYNFRVSDDVDEKAKIIQNSMALMEFFINDNIFVSKARLDEQLSRYDHSEDLRARYRDGKWVKAVGNSVFFEVFRPVRHIIGEYYSPANPDPEVLIPEPNCFSLLTGWDVGDINHAFTIAEKIFIKDTKDRPVSFFKYIDEVVSIHDDFNVMDFIRECLDRIEYWEDFIGHPVQWTNYSDRSAFERKDTRSQSGLYDHKLIFNESQGKIVLQACDRGHGSVLQRVNLNKKILFEGRMGISRSKCPNLIDSYQGLRPGKLGTAVQRHSKYKHAWDAASYLLAGELVDEIQRLSGQVNTGNASEGVIHVAL